MDTTGFIVIYVTTPTSDEAAKIARSLVERRQAACVNVIAGATSYYRWKGCSRQDPECLLVIKTRESLFDAVAATVKELTGYSVPEIIALPIVHGTVDILNWLEEETTGESRKTC